MAKYLNVSIPMSHRELLDTIVVEYKEVTGLKVSYAAILKKLIEEEHERIQDKKG